MVTFEKLENGNLKITLTPEGRAALQDNPEMPEWELYESYLCNGWESVGPEEIGALTSAFIMSDEVERDDHGRIVACGNVYSNIDRYQLESDGARLLRDGHIVYLRAS